MELYHGSNVAVFSIRRERAAEVFLLMRRMSGYNDRNANGKKKKDVIMRPAGDDWF